MTVPVHIQKAIQAYYAERITDEQLAALEDWFREDEANIKLFAEHGLVEWHMLCEHEKQDAAAILTSLREAEEKAEPDFSLLETPASFGPASHEVNTTASFGELLSLAGYLTAKTLRSQAVAIASVAAVLVIGLVLYIAFTGPSTTPDAPQTANNPTSEPGRVGPANPITLSTVATLTATHNAVWASPQAERALARGSELTAGTKLTLTAGFAEITTNDGAVAILEAPATIELLNNDNALRLHAGKIVGICETESSKGFLVRTPHMDIIDLGTEFGIHVYPEGVEASVFVGEVEIVTLEGNAQRLTQSQTARVTDQGTEPVLTVESGFVEGFTRRMPRAQLVQSARIVNGGPYRPVILTQGFLGSARLFTDREWRLVDSVENPLPQALVGGDLVSLPINLVQKSNLPFEIELTARETVSVYLLRPPEAHLGNWLERDYTNTGMTVSIMGPYDPRACEVWKRKAPLEGSQKAAWQTEPDSLAVYCFVITPGESN